MPRALPSCCLRSSSGIVSRCLPVGKAQHLQSSVINVTACVAMADSLGSNAGLDEREGRRCPALEHRAPELEVSTAVMPDRDEPGILEMQPGQECPAVANPMERTELH